MIDLDTEVVLAASIRPADEADVDTMVDSLIEASVHLTEAGVDVEIEEAVADKGYHATDTIELADSLNIRTSFPNGSRRANGTCATCRRRSAEPCSTIGGACVAQRASGCNVSGANGWNGALPISVTPAARAQLALRVGEGAKALLDCGDGAEPGVAHVQGVRIGTPRGLQAAGGLASLALFVWIHIHRLWRRLYPSQSSACVTEPPCATAA